MKDSKSWSDQMIELGRKQTAVFTNNHLAYTNCLCEADSLRNLMHDVYCALVIKGKVTRIEDQEIEDKTALWEQTKDIAAGRLNQSKMVELSRVLVTIEYFLNEDPIC